ncbi:MAG: NAD(P)/FAD-dependent oxidoreductase [Candidatus Methylacidiphilales bacterium]|nr:NAD(P)/FAD-dependent oxidoreductase [Candidatus Methylacidiphilales bacterium]
MSNEFDVVIVGGGSAGYAAARTAVSLGARVAVVEGGPDVGGLCILRGCMPSKTLLESSYRWHEILRAREFGLDVKPGAPVVKEIIARKRTLIGGFADYRKEQLESGKFTFYRATASFTDAHTLALKAVGKSGAEVPATITGKTFILTTGSQISPVKVPGLKEAGYLTSDTALDNEHLPESIIVLGGGVIAVELGQYYAHLGTKVTLLQRSAHILKENDDDVIEVIEKSFRKDGVNLLTGTSLIDVSSGPDGKTVRFTHEGVEKSVTAEEIFFALGREPRVKDLNLEAAGVELKGKAIGVDSGMRTSAEHIFAAGDVVGLYEIVHVAISQGECAAWNAVQLLRGDAGKSADVTLLAGSGPVGLPGVEASDLSPGSRGHEAPTESHIQPCDEVTGKAPCAARTMDYRLKTTVTFTHPEIASVGVTEKEARAAGTAFKAAKYPFDDHGKSMIMGATEGFVKVIAEPTRGEIIGAHIVGPHASDLIHELIAVMYFRGTVKDLATIPHYHPTLAEIATYPAEELAEEFGLV